MINDYYTVITDRADGSKFNKGELVQQLDNYSYFQSVDRPEEQWHLNSDSIIRSKWNKDHTVFIPERIKSRLELIED